LRLRPQGALDCGSLLPHFKDFAFANKAKGVKNA
jgi:hypothetical protein